tara:strand:+ start:8160 stop:8372 length:213 start_codon:yes stop_codon:yes gene_type:complete
MISSKEVKERANEIDAALDVMCITAERDETLTTHEIAELCGCSQSYISQLIRDGLQKLRGKKGMLLRDFI